MGADDSDARSGLVAGGQGGPTDQLLDDGQEEVFAREEVESGRVEHQVSAGGGHVQGDPGEANRGIGQQIVGEASPASRDDTPGPAAGGSGSGSGETIGQPKHQRPIADGTPRVSPD